MHVYVWIGPVALLLAEEGLVGVAAETLDAAEQALKERGLAESRPPLCLLRASSGEFIWHITLP